MIIINPETRQFNIPGAELVFGVESDAGSERKYFQCPRYVGNNLDLMSCFVRMNFRNANGAMDSYLVDDVAVDGDNVTFSWVLSEKAVKYKGHVKFVVCVVGPNQKVEWHTTLGSGMVLEGLEPDTGIVESGTADVVAQLIAMVEQQTAAFENVGETWVENVKNEGATQVAAVKTAAKTAETASVAEIEAKGVNTRESIPTDYTALSEAVEGLVRGRAGAIVCHVEGSAVAVSDASDLPMQGMRIFGRSTQDGTPTPDAPVEIVSVENPVVTVCGKNLFKMGFEPGYTETVRGVTFAVNADRSIHVTGTPTAAIAYNIFEGEVIPVGNYFVSGAPATASQKFRLQVNLNVNGTEKTGGVDMGEGSKLPVDASVSSLRGYIYVAGDAGEVDGLFYPQLEAGSVATEYEPYSGQTVEITHTIPGIPVDTGGNYTDSDGQQWICDEVDLERGVYVQRIGSLTFTGEESWSKSQYYENTVQKSRSGLASGSAYLCNMYAETTLNVNHGVVLGGAINIRDDVNATDVNTWKEHLRELYSNGTPVVIFGALAESVETPLSETEIAAYRALHSNYPNTTVLNDAGAHMVVKYAADTKLYIDNKIAALTAQA